MISWHKVGQKVAVMINGRWTYKEVGFELSKDVVYEISSVRLLSNGVYFKFVEIADQGTCELIFHSRGFRPVYPEIIDQLRTLPSLTPDRVKEDA